MHFKVECHIILAFDEKCELSHDFSILRFLDSIPIVRRCKFYLMDFRPTHDVYDLFIYVMSTETGHTIDIGFSNAQFTNKKSIPIHYSYVISLHLINKIQI